MNAVTQTLIRSVLKILAGFLVAKGLADESTAEVIAAGLFGAVGVVWGVVHRQLQSKRVTIKQIMPLLLVAGGVTLLAGCSFVRVRDDQRQAGFTAVMPAWPWQDSSRVIEKMNLSAKTNSFTASVRGLSDSETTTTNATDLVSSVVGAAVKAAIGKP